MPRAATATKIPPRIYTMPKKGDIEAEKLIKWVSLALLTAGIVIVLMKGMLFLAVYLIKTLPISMVS